MRAVSAPLQKVKATDSAQVVGQGNLQQERASKPNKKVTQQSKGGAPKASVVSSSATGESSSSAVTKKNRRKKQGGDRSAAKSSDGFASGEDPVGKIKLKTVVRRLPPNVPESIFWKAVSPWVIRSKSLFQQENGNGAGNTETGDGREANVDYAYFVQGKLKDNSRRGISSESGVSPHTFSRAYLHFTSIETLIDFHRGFDGHLFKDAKGNEYIAIVEFAPCQRTPLDLARRRKQDPKQGTIEEGVC